MPLQSLRGQPRSAVVLFVLVLVSQLVSLLYPPARTNVFGFSLLVLDPLGAVYAFKAARRGSSVLTWRVVGAGRALSLCATIAFSGDTLTHSPYWYWSAVGSGVAMFICLSVAALSISTNRMVGSQRVAFIAEVGTVLCSGFMMIWYYALAPAIQRGATRLWGYELGYPLGNLLLLSAVVAVLIRGAVARMAQPLTVLLLGMLMYAIGDAAFSAARVQSYASTNSVLSTVLVFASLLMTVAAMEQNAAKGDDGPPISQMPSWSAHLPYLAVGLGSTLLVIITAREHAFMPWGGLILGQIGMTAALAARQIMSVRDSHRLTVIDALTGLKNISGLQQAVDRAQRGRARTALMLIDLDGFKLINDGYGHEVGDRVLVEFSRLLRGAVRRDDVPARVGGDEFVVLLNDVDDQRQVIAIAERVLAALVANPVSTDGDEITIRASIGLAVSEPDEPAKELQRRADLAMYESKRSGTHGWRIYEPSMTDRRVREGLIADKLLPGLSAGQFSVNYQPIVDMATGSVRAVEALLRWTHPSLGSVSPMEFIPVAERSGAILDIGRWILQEACVQVKRWQDEGHPELRASVNVSAQQLQEPGYVTDVLAVLDRTGLSPESLSLEVTESAVVDERIAVPTLEALRGYGVRVAVDDFGTGYSSLYMLARLPVDTIKIDRSFVAELDSTSRGAAVAEAVIRLGQALGLQVVAEGVETAAQAAELQMLGCSTAQGYLFGKPMTAPEFTAASSRALHDN